MPINYGELLKIYLRKHLVLTTMSILLAIISTILLNKACPALLLLKSQSITANLWLEGIAFFCLWFIVGYFTKNYIGYWKSITGMKDKLLKLSYDEKLVIATMFHTRELPENMIGLKSLNGKGIININEAIILNSGITLGHPVEYTPIIKKALKAKMANQFYDLCKKDIKILIWQKQI